MSEANHCTELPEPAGIAGIETVADSRYWAPFPGETPELYEHLGIRAFKKYMPFPTGDIVGKIVGMPSILPSEGSPEERLRSLVEKTKFLEQIHLVGLTIMGTLGLVGECTTLSELQPIKSLAVISASNIVINVYPIMLQRYNRLRAGRALAALSTESGLQLTAKGKVPKNPLIVE